MTREQWRFYVIWTLKGLPVLNKSGLFRGFFTFFIFFQFIQKKSFFFNEFPPCDSRMIYAMLDILSRHKQHKSLKMSFHSAKKVLREIFRQRKYSFNIIQKENLKRKWPNQLR